MVVVDFSQVMQLVIPARLPARQSRSDGYLFGQAIF